MDSIDDESIGVREHGFEEHGAEGLIASSVDFCWAGLSAVLRGHNLGVITKSTKPETEVCVAICPSNSLVTRLIGGVVDRTIAERGTIWLAPPRGRVSPNRSTLVWRDKLSLERTWFPVWAPRSR